jgi:hypothetical protein
MTTALDIIKASMRKAGILVKSESPAADEASDALDTLNDMIESWANDELCVPFRTLESFTLSGGTAIYTIGSGGTFNTVRPIQIISGFTRDGTNDRPIKIIGDDEYSSISYKGALGRSEYLNYSNEHPLSTIKLYPTPDIGYALSLLTEKQLGAYTLNQTVDLPAGWRRALVYCLAVELSPEYGVQLPQEVGAVASDSFSKIKMAAARNKSLDCQPISHGAFDIYTGWQ